MNEETKPHSATVERDDSGLIAYATILALHRIPVDPNQLRHGVGHNRAIDADDLKRIAKRQDDVNVVLALGDALQVIRIDRAVVADAMPELVRIDRDPM